MLAGFRDGDLERARAFVRRFQGRVYGLAVKMTGDPVWADDIAQDALLRAWRGASSFDPARGSVTTWLLTITPERSFGRVTPASSRIGESTR